MKIALFAVIRVRGFRWVSFNKLSNSLTEIILSIYEEKAPADLTI